MIVFKFEKDELAGYLSHLDTARAIKRAMYRANIKMDKSQGFNPHPLLFFALPIPLGVSSKCEYCTVVTNYNTEAFIKDFNKVSPNGIKILEAFKIEKNPNLAKNIKASKYLVKCENIGKYKEKIKKLLSEKEFWAEHKTKKGIKQKDLKPYIIAFEINDNEVKCILKSGNENLRPDRLLNSIAVVLNNQNNNEENNVISAYIDFSDVEIIKLDSYCFENDNYIATDDYLKQIQLKEKAISEK